MSYYSSRDHWDLSSLTALIASSAADADVDFPQFCGINLQFNGGWKAVLQHMSGAGRSLSMGRPRPTA